MDSWRVAQASGFSLGGGPRKSTPQYLHWPRSSSSIRALRVCAARPRVLSSIPTAYQLTSLPTRLNLPHSSPRMRTQLIISHEEWGGQSRRGAPRTLLLLPHGAEALRPSGGPKAHAFAQRCRAAFLRTRRDFFSGWLVGRPPPAATSNRSHRLGCRGAGTLAAGRDAAERPDLFFNRSGRPLSRSKTALQSWLAVAQRPC